MASRYEERFGTFDKVATYFAVSCFLSDDGSACRYCPLVEDCDGTLGKVGKLMAVRAEIAKWLRGDAE